MSAVFKPPPTKRLPSRFHVCREIIQAKLCTAARANTEVLRRSLQIWIRAHGAEVSIQVRFLLTTFAEVVVIPERRTRENQVCGYRPVLSQDAKLLSNLIVAHSIPIRPRAFCHSYAEWTP
jgi:hypothetical protein